MKVSTNKPFQVVYSVYHFEYLGHLIQAYAVQLDAKGQPTLRNQNLSTKNIKEFSAGLDDTDLALIELVESIQKDAVLRKFNHKNLKPNDFFLRTFDSKKGDSLLREEIWQYLDWQKAAILPLLIRKPLFISGNDNDPTWKKVSVEIEPAKVTFHFFRNPASIHYFPGVRHNHEKVDLQHNSILLCEEPAWLLQKAHLYHFSPPLDGKKLLPFLQKKFVQISLDMEEKYLRTFVAPLVATQQVLLKGFEVIQESPSAQAVLTLNVREEAGANIENDAKGDVVWALAFRYGTFTFAYEKNAPDTYVALGGKSPHYKFHKIRRDAAYEKATVGFLAGLNLAFLGTPTQMPKVQAFSWLHEYRQKLEAKGIEVCQSHDGRRYFIGYSDMQVSMIENETNDWFDLRVLVRFGEFEIPFLFLRNHLIHQRSEFTLPDGTIAVIPEAWLTKYSTLFALAQSKGPALRLSRHHFGLVQNFEERGLATVIMDRRLIRAGDSAGWAPQDLPRNFRGILRPYQKQGFDWMCFLNEFRFGGCLADDMGLGKTVQALALLQSEKENGVKAPSLLVLPTSLLYNWALEAKKFVPGLRVFSHTGTGRQKTTRHFEKHDLIITTYGVLRIDIGWLSKFPFHYVILDESQAIKNPASAVTKAVTQLQSAHKLGLTGTPLENSTMDLWSQLNFLNPGLLGSQNFFRKQFLIPIEKQHDEAAAVKLSRIIKPFILRRTKAQVATDLPEKTVSEQFCDMTPEQETYYEKTKSVYRNQLLGDLEKKERSNLLILKGLMHLRQIANHPGITDADYTGGSGKFEDVIHNLETAIDEGHKILVFSQFIRHLALFRGYLDEKKHTYSYLDGSTRDRQEQIEHFRADADNTVFLISLKAGGVGLNLVEADYVFMLDPWWNPAVEAQAIDRAHRIGQDKPVFTYKYITRGTVEEKILELQKKKKKLAEEFISGDEPFLSALSGEELASLLQ